MPPDPELVLQRAMAYQAAYMATTVFAQKALSAPPGATDADALRQAAAAAIRAQDAARRALFDALDAQEAP